MGFADQLTKKLYVAKVAGLTNDPNAEDEGRKDIHGLKIKFADTEKTFMGLKSDSPFQEIGVNLVLVEEYISDGTWTSPFCDSFCLYDPNSKQKIESNNKLSDDTMKYFTKGDLHIGNLIWMISNTFLARVNSKWLRGSSKMNAQGLDYSQLRAMRGREHIILFAPSTSDKPTEIYHGRSGNLMCMVYNK